jgi:hypothetical protein
MWYYKRSQQLKFSKVIALTTLLYGNESWAVRTKNMNRIQSVETRYLRTVRCCTRLDHIEIEDIRKETRYSQYEIKWANIKLDKSAEYNVR